MPEDNNDEIAAAMRAAADKVTVVSTGDLARAVYGRSARKQRIKTLRRIAAGTVAALVVAAAGVGVGLHNRSSTHHLVVGAPSVPTLSSSTTGLQRTSVPKIVPAKSETTSYPPLPPVTGVPGYSSSQAAAVVSTCLAALGETLQGALLRATATDSYGSTLVITTTGGWETCNVPAGGAPQLSGSQVFQSWAAADGWATPTDTPDYYLTGSIEIVASGGGLISQSVSGWRNYLIGRASSNVASVSVVMPNGATVSAKVQNGLFIIDQITPNETVYNSGGINVLGYDADGKVVYQPPQSANSSDVPCYVTPDGQAVTPSNPGQTCSTAIPWG